MSKRPTPAFATGGSFQALAIDNLNSSGSEEEVVENEEPPQRLIEKTSGTQPSKNVKKKSKYKTINPKKTTTNKTTVTPSLQHPTNPVEKLKPAPSTTHSSQSAEPIESNLKHSFKSLTIPSSDQLDKFSLNPHSTPLTSPSISTTTSIITSPSTSDFDDQEELAQPNPPSGNLKTHQHLHSTQSQPHPSSLNPTPILTSNAQSRSITSPQPSPSPTPTQQTHLTFKSDSSSKAPAESTEISQFGIDHTPGKKWQTVLTRVFWSLVMVTGFITLMALGHVYLIILVFIIQLLVFREVTNLFQVGYKASAREHANKLQDQAQAHHHQQQQYPQQFSSSVSPAIIKQRKKTKDVAHKNRLNKLMSWYFFGVANYFLYGESIIYYFKHIVFIDEYLIPFARHHRFISLMMYLIGFLGFVTNLDRGHLRRQFGLFSWIHMSLLLIIVFGQFMVNNILEGLIWFWVPASLVIMNDVAAYVFGMLFGKHQLIKLSPKKTVEGFVGGFFMTVIFGVLWGSLFMGWNYMICPVKDLGMTAFSDVRCEPNAVFKWRSIEMGRLLVDELRLTIPHQPTAAMVERLLPSQLWWTPFQLHCLVLAIFAGLVAPFGGFFASGFKRAFNVKDFGHTIPGHGGLTDRFDCQFIMGVFTYFYYSSMIKEDDDGLIRSLENNKFKFSVQSVLQIILFHLSDPQQLQIFSDLQTSLRARGLVPA